MARVDLDSIACAQTAALSNLTRQPYLVVAELLEARRYALAALRGKPERSPPVSASSWELFLSLERCAGILLESLSSNVPSDAAAPLREAAARDAQSSLQARLEGRQLSEIASRLDFPVVVLKGGAVAVAGKGASLPLVDLDVLVQRQHVGDLSNLLRDAGFGLPSRATAHHVGFVPPPDRLAIEVHWTTHDDGSPVDSGIWNRIRPIDGVAHLKRLAPPDNLEHLLRHAIIVHHERSVSLRDVYLAGLSAAECTAEELVEVEKKLSRDVHSQPLFDLLTFARALTSRWPNAQVDPFAQECATFYSAMVLAARGRIASPAATSFVMTIALGRATRAQATRSALTFRGTGHESLGRLASTAPALIEPILGLGHAAYYLGVSAVMLPRIRRTAAKALARAALRSR